jgi:hypothetical protein
MSTNRAKTQRVHPPMLKGGRRHGEKIINESASFKRERQATTELTPEQEKDRQRKQHGQNEQFQVDNPKLRGNVFTPNKPTETELKTARQELDEAASRYMTLKRMYDYPGCDD